MRKSALRAKKNKKSKSPGWYSASSRSEVGSSRNCKHKGPTEHENPVSPAERAPFSKKRPAPSTRTAL